MGASARWAVPLALVAVVGVLLSTGPPRLGPGPVAVPAGSPVWMTPLPDDARLADDSDEMAARLARQARYSPDSEPVAGFANTGYQAIVQHDKFSVPVYEVPEDQPRTRVELVDDEGAPRPPGENFGLQDTWLDVPVPTDVEQLQADGTDGHLVLHQPATDTLWEFWRFQRRTDGGYQAAYGARVDGWSTSTGVLPNRWGARAASLALLGGVMRMQDYVDGVFPYALGVALPVLDDRVVPPATRTDGPVAAVRDERDDDALSQGMRFRLPADADCDREGWTRLLSMMCTAVRDFGMVVNDRTGGSVSFFAEDDRSVGTPYSPVKTSPWDRELQEQFSGPDSVLVDFPWDELELLEPPTNDQAG